MKLLTKRGFWIAVAVMLVVLTFSQTRNIADFFETNLRGAGPMLFITLTALNIVFANVPAMVVLAPMASQLFGPGYGLIYLTLGEAIGATVWFLGFKHFGNRAAKALFNRRVVYPKRKEKRNKLFWSALALRQIPGVPLPLLSLVLVPTGMPGWKFFVVMFAASFPIDAIYLLVGVTFFQSLLWLAVLLALLLGIAAVIGWHKRSELKDLKALLPHFEKLAETP